MLKTFETVKDFKDVKNLGIRILEDEQIGFFTKTDVVTIKGLLGVFNMTSNYNSDGDVSRRNLEKKEMIYCILKDAERELKQNIGGVIDITSSIENEIKEVKRMLIGDNMEIKEQIIIFEEKELEKLSDKEYDALGCIAERTIEEDKDTTYNYKYEVIIALMNKYGVNIRNTEAYKKLVKSLKNSKNTISTNTFYDVLYDALFEWDAPLTNFNKDIIIECVVEDASFDYDYGSISSTYYCSTIVGYNIIFEDIE